MRIGLDDTAPGNTLAAKYERERWVAESLQRVLLRTLPPEAFPGVSVEAFYEAALEEATVGGDSFDAFPLGDGRVALVVADASGKGLETAERIAEIRFALRAFLREHGDPRRVLSCLNDFVCEAQRLDGRDDGTFTTLTRAVLDCLSGDMVCLCAGGEPPLVLRAGSRQFRSVARRWACVWARSTRRRRCGSGRATRSYSPRTG